MEEKQVISFFPLGSSPSSGLGKSSNLAQAPSRLLFAWETGCQVQFHSNYSSVKIINFLLLKAAHCVPLLGCISCSKELTKEIWREIWSESQCGRDSRTRKACFAFQMGKKKLRFVLKSWALNGKQAELGTDGGVSS